MEEQMVRTMRSMLEMAGETFENKSLYLTIESWFKQDYNERNFLLGRSIGLAK